MSTLSPATEDYIVTLGSKGGASVRSGGPMPSSNLLRLAGETVVVDCGLGVAAGLLRQGTELTELKTIFITHLHSDHYLELGPLLHAAWTSGLKTPVSVYGPAGLADYWRHFLEAMRVDVDLRVKQQGRIDLASLVEIYPLEEAVLLSDKLRVSALNTNHPPLEDTFAYRFETDTKSVIFSGDTSPISTMADFAKDADVLVHEAMLPERVPSLLKSVGGDLEKLMHHITEGHSPTAEVAAIASRAGVKHLVLNHLIPALGKHNVPDDWNTAIEPNFAGRFSLATDGLRIDF